MYKPYQLFLSLLLTGILLNFLSMFTSVYADPTVAIINKENLPKEIYIGLEPVPIFLNAEANPRGVTYQWDQNGPGELKGETTSPGIMYLQPEVFDPTSDTVTITVTVTDKGKTATDRVTFMFRPPQLPDYTTEQLLTMAKNCFKKNFLTTPKEMNAFDIYKEILKKDAENTPAREEIREVMTRYIQLGDEHRKTMKNRYDQEVSRKAKEDYQKSFEVAKYLRDTLHDASIEPEIQKIQNQLKELTVLDIRQSLEPYKQLKAREQTGSKVDDEIISAIRKLAEAVQGTAKTNPSEEVEPLLKEADGYFKKKDYTNPPAPPEKNALDGYKKVLTFDPENRIARDRLYEIANRIRQEEKRATKKRDDKQIELSREEYGLVVGDLLSILADQLTQAGGALQKASAENDQKEGIIQTLRIIEVLREIKRVYAQSPEMQDAVQKIDGMIAKYEPAFLRTSQGNNTD